MAVTVASRMHHPFCLDIIMHRWGAQLGSYMDVVGVVLQVSVSSGVALRREWAGLGVGWGVQFTTSGGVELLGHESQSYSPRSRHSQG